MFNFGAHAFNAFPVYFIYLFVTMDTGEQHKATRVSCQLELFLRPVSSDHTDVTNTLQEFLFRLQAKRTALMRKVNRSFSGLWSTYLCRRECSVLTINFLISNFCSKTFVFYFSYCSQEMRFLKGTSLSVQRLFSFVFSKIDKQPSKSERARNARTSELVSSFL